MRRSLVVLALFVALGALPSACADLKDAPPASTADAAPDAVSPAAPSDGGATPGTDGAAPSDGATSADSSPDAAPRTGPGPHGSLPTGYCCSSDAECRYRRCVDVTVFGSGSGAKMCLDDCYDSPFCTRPDLTFSCQKAGSGAGVCVPPAGGFTCLDPAKFTRGPREIGGCCNAALGGPNDGTAGSQCEGNTCAATGTGPLVCTHRCEVQGDCPAGYLCNEFGTSKACVPSTSSYTCSP